MFHITTIAESEEEDAKAAHSIVRDFEWAGTGLYPDFQTVNKLYNVQFSIKSGN